MGKVIQGAVLAVVLVFAGSAWRIVLVRHAEQSIQDTIQATAQRQQLLAEQQRHRDVSAQVLDVQRRELAQDQRCVGGTVITVRGNVYTQDLGADGRPIRCVGAFATVPLR